MVSLYWSDVDEQVEKQDASDEDDLELNCRMDGMWASLCNKSHDLVDTRNDTWLNNVPVFISYILIYKK